jgi:hypothetical protein
VAHHRGWLSLVEVSGPFLSLPVLRDTWPAGLDALDKPVREQLRREHGVWQDDTTLGQKAWIEFVLRELLALADTMQDAAPDQFAVEVAEQEATLTPSFVVIPPGNEATPDQARLLGMVCPPEQHPTMRIPDEAWAATPVDRIAQMCRHHGVELGLVTNGRWWALVWAPRGKVTGVAVFDAAAWAEAAERDVVRAFISLLGRTRFFGVREEQQLVALLRASLDSQEEITDALGVQVRKAVELLVAAVGRSDVAARKAGRRGVEDVDAHDVYRGAVSIMMRIVFLLFAEERGLLPSDNELYARAYSATRLGEELEQQAREGSEDELETRTDAWRRLIALFEAVHGGVDHPRLRMPGHDGGLFDPENYLWLPLSIDDRTVLHVLRAVQWVRVGKGRNAEARKLSFRALDVEQIGYVYEGLLSFDGLRAAEVVVGLIGKEGLEDEVPLRELEQLAGSCADTTVLGAALAEKYKASKIGSARALTAKLAPLDGTAQEEARKRLLAVTNGDYPLAERLLPFAGLLRSDLRELPVVILPGALYVTESALRRNTGTHYTPRDLAEEVVLHALEPLVYSPGPLQTADKALWKPVTSGRILELKVADIAMGSAAFLVAAARYLGARLVEAWVREDDARVRDYIPRSAERSVDADGDPITVEARRQVIEHCLYGVDINPMAVEMAKLSLWLVSMDARRPFTFLDDRLVAGDSLLGITSLEQLEYLHLDPKCARELQEGTLDWSVDVRAAVARIAGIRRQLTAIELGDDPIAALEHKRGLLAEADLAGRQFALLADLTVGAALAASKKWTGSRDPNRWDELEIDKRVSRDGLFLQTIAIAGKVLGGSGMPAALQKRRQWLATDQVEGSFGREPLHWPLVFPEVFDRGGFDAVIGNPPFLHGSKISGSSGGAYRAFLVDTVAGGRRGNADLVVYFILRAHELLSRGGQSGLIATNSLAQGDSREVGLDHLQERDFVIRRAIKTRPWPSKSAALEYCAVWTSAAALDARAARVVDGRVVARITTSLEPASQIEGRPIRLRSSQGLAFNGTKVTGSGFIMDPSTAQALIFRDGRNSDVLFPYLNGDDVNSRPDCSASRWVINFHDWNELQAKIYEDCFRIALDRVRPERNKSNVRNLRDTWWQFERRRPELLRSLDGLKSTIVLTRHTSTVMPAIVSTRQVLSDATVVFASDDVSVLALLSSAPHYWWAKRYGSSIKADLRYTPSDVFETFPLPDLTLEMQDLGDRLDTYRRQVMLARQTGLTKTYNLVFDPAITDSDIVELRAIHRAIDEATVRAYDWNDLLAQLDHGFHPAGRDLRYTIGPAAQQEILDRLLELNHERYAEEVSQGLHDKGKKRAKNPSNNDEVLF